MTGRNVQLWGGGQSLAINSSVNDSSEYDMEEIESNENAETEKKLSRRKRQSAAMKARWADTAFKEKMRAAIKAAWDADDDEHPDQDISR